MNRIITTIFSVAFFVVATTAAYAKTSTEHYIFHYETGDIYDFQITENSATWKGLEGSDKGQSETDYIKRKTLSNDMEVIQWKEMNGTFVTLVLDRAHLSIVSSGITSDGDWLMSGNATIN